MTDNEKLLYERLLNEADTLLLNMANLDAESEAYKRTATALSEVIKQIDTLKTLELASKKEELDEKRFELDEKKFRQERELNDSKNDFEGARLELDKRRMELDEKKFEYEAEKQKKENAKAYVSLGVQAAVDTAKVVVPAVVTIGAAQAMTALEKEGTYYSGSAGKIFMNLVTKIR